MSFTHANAPRPIVENGRTGIKVIESSGARAMMQPKKKYRDPLLEDQEEQTNYVKPNIMYDPRVLRGTTAGKTAILASTVQAEAFASTIPRGTTKLPSVTTASSSPPPSRPSKQQLLQTGLIRPSQPSVAYIHNHITVVKKRVEVPMHLYLIEQKEETLVHHIDQQTDELMEEPPTPDYIPRKTGVDVASQVENAMVFHFDTDVQALLEIVVSKTLEQALMEVREEEELSEINQHKQELLEKYNSEESEALEKLRQERALFLAKEKLLADARIKQQHLLAIRAKLAAGLFSRRYLANLSKHAIEDLTQAGYFYQHDSVSHQLEASYMPGLVHSVDLELAKTSGARTLVTEMVAGALEQEQARAKQVLQQRAKEQAALDAQLAKERAVAEELARRQARIQLFIHSSAVPAEQSPVGPINLTGESTVQDIENKVYKWMEENLGEEDLPKREYLKFLWNGVELSKDNENLKAVYDLGISNLAQLTMELNLPPPEVKEKGEDDEDESGSGSGSGEEEEKGEGEEEEEEPEEEDEDDV